MWRRSLADQPDEGELVSDLTADVLYAISTRLDAELPREKHLKSN